MKKSICFRNSLFSFLAIFLTLNLWSMANARPVTQRTVLEKLSRFFYQQLQVRRPKLYYDLLRSVALPQRRLNEDPDVQLMYINERGHPVFYTVENLDAARTISTDDVWPGGSGGFSLSGSGTALGELCIWDAGGVLTTHQELIGRVTQMDSPGGTHYHSTHVAGTMMAEGVQSAAKGMSFEGTLAAYDWNNDDSEMASAAASGMNVSNHSYGFITGWYWNEDWYWFGDITVSTTEDYGFGFYGPTAQAWDSISYNAPYYTIVKSAGNDRNDYGPGPGGGHWVWQDGQWVWSTDTRDPDGGDDGYDCISWNGTAKNIITVGAVDDIPNGYTRPEDVVMSDFSGWGPTDDGRIKPDLVANGILLYSCTDVSNTSYASYSGTSMSSPNLSGSLNLLIRHYEATHGDSTPLSSTIKAIVIQTADEAGPNPGPDYQFGWGLMNTLKAAELIEADSQEPRHIIEESLTNGETDEYCLYSDGTQPVRVTLVWTDPPGTSSPPSLNPTTLMLVNDLDLRLEHLGTSTIYQPWVLDLNNPDNPAGKGDNVRDNVEQIHVASPLAGSYRITVTHKGVLASAQYYSIVSSSRMYPGGCNQPPVLDSIGPKSVVEGDTLSFTVTASDPDLDSLILSAAPLPTNADFVDNGDGSGDFLFIPDDTQSGVYDITFVASDGSLADSELVSITVIDINRPPVLDSIGPKAVVVGDTLNFIVTATDPDLDSIILSAESLPTNASFVDNGDGSGEFIFIPDSTQAAVYGITFVASDGSLADSELVTVTVTYACGDCNGDGRINGADATYLVTYIYRDGRAPLGQADVNLDGRITGADAIYIITYIYRGGSPPCNPPLGYSPYSDEPATIAFSSPRIQNGVVEIPVVAEFSVPLAFAHLQVTYDDKVLEPLMPTLTPRTEGLDLFCEPSLEKGRLKLGMLSLTADHLIQPGDGAVVMLRFKSSSREANVSSLRIEEAILVNEQSRELKTTVSGTRLPPSFGVSAIFSLSQNYPNPLSDYTLIHYSCPRPTHVSLRIYDINGRVIKTLVDDQRGPGHFSVEWDGKDDLKRESAAGIYFYRIEAHPYGSVMDTGRGTREFTSTKMMILLR